MPELPEVETVRRGLAPAMEGAIFDKVEVNRPNLRFPFPDNFARRLEEQSVTSVSRRAKYLSVFLHNGAMLVMHLGMSGSFHIEHAQEDDSLTPDLHQSRNRLAKHDHVIFHMKSKAGKFSVIYNDPRRFGFMDLVEKPQIATYKYFANLGIEPTGNALDADNIIAMFANKNVPLKSALLDQSLIAGLGNIYVCEALWQAGLSPKRLARTIGTRRKTALEKADKLANEIRDVIERAIAAGGSSLNDHRQTDGTLGYFQHSFNVYDREDETCRKANCEGTIKRITQSGRSTYYCAHCQR